MIALWSLDIQRMELLIQHLEPTGLPLSDLALTEIAPSLSMSLLMAVCSFRATPNLLRRAKFS